MSPYVENIYRRIRGRYSYISIQTLLELYRSNSDIAPIGETGLDSLIHQLCQDRLLVDEDLLPNVSHVESIDDLNDLAQAELTIPFITYKSYLIYKQKHNL